MKKKGLAIFIVTLFFLSLFLVSCPMDDPEFEIPEPSCNICNNHPCTCPSGHEPVAFGPWTGTWHGYGYGHGHAWADYWWLMYGNTRPQLPVRVDLTLVDGWIVEPSNIIFFGPEESPEYNDLMNSSIIPIVVRLNLFDVDQFYPDLVAGATYTFNGLRDAGNAAVRMIQEAWEAAHRLSISFDRQMIFVTAGSEETLTPAVTPAGTPVVWSSNRPDVTVDQDGKITAVTSGGFATITATVTLDGETISAHLLVFVI